MSDENPRQFAIKKIYSKDISFETPNSPQIFHDEKKWAPEVDVSLSNRSGAISQDVYETILSITVTAKLEGKVAYLAEVHQAGQFFIKGLPEEELRELLGSYCPNLLFPFIREAVASLVVKGGFPQLLLAPVNFELLYAQHMKAMKEQQEKTAQPQPQPQVEH
ncbi:MAG: protein-export chaperone SecB [Gammaproteobacteria bacterium]|nr:protein-export chaperone SecB [Gammaproteobacteria bacterium]